MGIEVDLLKNYPKTKRDPQKRGIQKTPAAQVIARRFGQEFFDGEREHGYGGFRYDPRFWRPVIPTFVEHFGLEAGISVLDVGCAKGFMLHDMAEMIPGIIVKGVDVSEYAITHAIDDMKLNLQVADAQELPFDDNSFDVVFSINTVHNLDKPECAVALQEIERVSRGRSFITVDAYRNDVEKELMYAWNLTAKTIMSVTGWKAFFDETGYNGDYYWFMP